MSIKIIGGLLLSLALTIGQISCQRRGSAAVATVHQRLKEHSIAAAQSPELPAWTGHIDNCIRTPIPSREKHGFSFEPFNKNDDSSTKIGILYRMGQFTNNLLRFFGGALGQTGTEPADDPAPVPIPNGDSEWPIPRFPGCAQPSCVAPDFAWSSPSTLQGGIDYMDLVLLHKDMPNILSNILNLGRTYNSSIDNAKACFQFRFDFNTLILNAIGFGKVSEDMKCVTHPSGHFALDCVAKSGLATSMYIIRSDKTSYALIFHCWSSGEQTWVLYGSPAAKYELTNDAKWDALRSVESLGFSPCDYELMDYSQ